MGIRDYVYLWNDKLKRTIKNNPEQSAMIPGMSYVERDGLLDKIPGLDYTGRLISQDKKHRGEVEYSSARLGEFLLDEEQGGLNEDNSIRKSFEFTTDNPWLGPGLYFLSLAGVILGLSLYEEKDCKQLMFFGPLVSAALFFGLRYLSYEGIITEGMNSKDNKNKLETLATKPGDAQK